MSESLLDGKPIKEEKLSQEELEECFTFADQNMVEVINVNNAQIAQWIMKSVPCACVVETKEILTYYRGTYIPEGEKYLHKILVECLSGYTKKGGTTVYNKKLLSEVIDILKGLSYRHICNFDDEFDWINLKNGLFNWRTGEFKEHTPMHFSRIQLPITYDPNAMCPNIDKLIEKVARPEDIPKCYEFFAYCLYRTYPIQKAFILLGPGKTGKTSFMDVIVNFLGSDNCSAVSLQDLSGRDKFASSDLYGHLANVCGDLDQTALNEAELIKKLTSNKDKIRAQEKGKPAFDFINFAKLIFGANKLPPTKDDTTGFYRRFEILPFMHVFTKEEYDAKFLESSTSPEELSGLFNKVVKLLPDLLARNEFTNQMSTEDAKAIYEELSNTEESFFEKFVHEEPNHYEPKDRLYENYRTYCEKIGTSSKDTKNKFGRWITKNISWIKTSNTSTTIDEKSVAAWANTKFDSKAFEEWKKSIV